VDEGGDESEGLDMVKWNISEEFAMNWDYCGSGFGKDGDFALKVQMRLRRTRAGPARATTAAKFQSTFSAIYFVPLTSNIP
jgi:hypothetical protein